MSEIEITAGERDDLSIIAWRLEKVEEIAEQNWSRGRAPGVSLSAYELLEYRNRTRQAVDDLRRIVSALSQRPGGGTAPPPGPPPAADPRDQEQLDRERAAVAACTAETHLCHCGLEISQDRWGPAGTWVRACPVHGSDYARTEEQPEATRGRSAGSHARAREDRSDRYEALGPDIPDGLRP